MTTRRAVLVGGTALALLPRPASAENDGFRVAMDAVQSALDGDGGPPRAAALLGRIDTRGLSVSQQLDLATARAGVRVDQATMLARPVAPTMRLQRILGDGIDLARASVRLEAERAACTSRAAKLFDRIGVSGADIGTRFCALWRGPRQRWPDATTALADMNRWRDRFRAAVPMLIGSVPEWCLNVSAAPPTAIDVTRGHFGYRTLPTPATSGGYVPDFARLADRPSFTLASVVAHELLPGHMIQLPMEAAVDPHPLRLRYAPTFAEGWGIYAERRVADAGFYACDPLAELGYLHWRLFRIGRALVDLAINVDRISLTEARARLVAWQGEPAYFAPFDADLDRIAKEPMTRAAEMLAALAIEYGARGRTGARLTRYHHMLLADGRMRSNELARRAAALR